MEPTIENLILKLREEKSFPYYYRYLVDLYSTDVSGSTFNMRLNDAQENSGVNESIYLDTAPVKGSPNPGTQQTTGEISSCQYDFARTAMERDLRRKSLPVLFAIAEAEKQYNPMPYLRAIDIYYRINPVPGSSEEDIAGLVKVFEEEERSS